MKYVYQFGIGRLQSIDGRLNAILWDGSGEQRILATENTHPVLQSCQLSFDNVPGVPYNRLRESRI